MTKRAVLIAAAPVSTVMAAYVCEGDYVVACDAGYRNAEILGVRPELIVGDFDSAPRPATDRKTIVLPHIKDDTDTHYAARLLLEKGYTDITILGALGGKRLEHTLASVSTGLFLTAHGARVVIADEYSELRYLTPEAPLTLPRADWRYLSLYPLENELTGVCLRGVFYPLQDAVLTAQTGSLSTSNEFTAPEAVVSCTGGRGLVVLTRADR